jgi:RsiW-degrading membrane proteinase PrsW (M82 family)
MGMVSSTFVYALLAGIVPSAVWLLFWLREDSQNPEPRTLLTAVFIGGVISVVAAIFAEKYIADTITDQTTRYAAWAAVEEILKFIAVALIGLSAASNDEPIDAMIYCITVALGFAAFENFLFALNPATAGNLAQSIVNDNMRFIGATLVHVVCSATIGFVLGWTFYRGYLAKLIALSVGLAAAIAMHAAFNLSIINSAPGQTLQAFGWVWGAVILLLVLFEEIKVVGPKVSPQDRTSTS